MNVDRVHTVAYGFGMTDRLTPEVWIEAGFRALADIGPQAVKAEPLARALGATKGSFYWHFKDVKTFHAEMLALWEARALTDIVETLDQLQTPEERLRALAVTASAPAPERFGGTTIEPAIRAWALQNPLIARGVAQVDAGRLAYTEQLLDLCNKPRAFGLVIYGAYVGLDDLQARGETKTPAALSLLIETILA